VADQPRERRKYERVKLFRPVRARVGKAWVFVNEMGVSGFSIAHQGTVPVVGKTFEIEIDWEGRLLHFECEVIHNDLQKLAKTKLEKSIYVAGAHIVSAKGDSAVMLRKIVAEHVERALDEQRANAMGIPATAAQAYQTGKATEYLRCELVNGAWRRSTTTRPEQPPNGFTVSANEEREQIDMLCESYASGDETARKMIREMASVSIGNVDGVPTRRYKP